MLIFFFNDTATTEIYTLSLHDALPICWSRGQGWGIHGFALSYAYTDQPIFLQTACQLADYALAHLPPDGVPLWDYLADRKSTRLNSSHANISYAVFCLKKKKYTTYITR